MNSVARAASQGVTFFSLRLSCPIAADMPHWAAALDEAHGKQGYLDIPRSMRRAIVHSLFLE